MKLLIFGNGYTGAAIASAARAAGHMVLVTSRTPDGSAGVVPFSDAANILRDVDAVLSTAAPDDNDPVLATHGAAIAASPARWLGYLSTTGVYGDRGGGAVDEDTAPQPAPGRGVRRLAAEVAWRDVARGRPLDVFRVAGIYGPGRSVFADVLGGYARRIVKPGQAFGRIHRDDIAGAAVAAMHRPSDGCRVLNLTDDLPAPNAEVIAEAARLLGLPPPPAIPFEEAAKTMSSMGLSFWAENRRVACAKTKAALDRPWRYPTYREGLAATLAEEFPERAGQQGQV